MSKPLNGHLINKPLIMQFYNAHELQEIDSNKLLDEAPHVEIPKFQFFKQDIQANFAKDEKLVVDMHRAVEAARKDEQIANNLPEAIILHEQQEKNYWFSLRGMLGI